MSGPAEFCGKRLFENWASIGICFFEMAKKECKRHEDKQVDSSGGISGRFGICRRGKCGGGI